MDELEARDYHHRHVLIIVLRGEGEIEADGRPIRLQAGTALLLSPFVLHHHPKMHVADPCWLYVTFDREQAGADHLAAVEQYQLQPEAMSVIELMIHWRLAVGQGVPDARASRSMSLGVTLLLERLAASPCHAGSASSHPSHEDQWLFRVLKRIRDVNQPPPSLEDLAEVASLSPSHLRAVFRKRFGVSLGMYCRHMRVRQAMSLVVNQNLTISQAAWRCRFSSVYTFSRSAKAVLGCPPTTYLKRMRKASRTQQ